MSNKPASTESAAALATEAVSPRPRRRLRNLLSLGGLVVLFLLAIWASSLFRASPVHKDPAENSLNLPIEDPLTLRTKPVPAAGIRARGDNALRQFRITEALAQYTELLGAGLAPNAGIDYRLGLCNEATGQLDAAIADYRRAIAASPSRSLTFASHLAMARCLLRQNRPGETRRLLYPFLLNETRHPTQHEKFATDAYYLVALSLAWDGAKPVKGRASQDELLSANSTPLDILMLLDEIEADRQSVADSREPRLAVPLAVQARTGNEPAIVLCAEQPDQPIADLLERLATEGGLHVTWTAAAKKCAADRELTLHLHDWQLRDVLEMVSDFLDLACEFSDDGGVHFSARTEIDGKRLEALRRDMTQRSLQSALHADADHRYAAAALLELGNNAAAEKNWGDAASWYQRLIREDFASPHVAPAYFNLARAHLQNNHPRQARKAYFRMMDQSPGHELALRACIELSQLYLDENEPRQAIVHLQRAQGMAGNSHHQQVATLVLAAAYLHGGDPEAARRTLAKDRAALQKEGFHATAAFLDSYTSYRLAKKAAREANVDRREANELIDALWSTNDVTLLGARGHWLMAQAYHDLGFLDQAERVLRLSQVKARGPFKACVDCSLAEILIKRNQRAEAALLLAKWAAADTPFRARTQFLLARLELAEKRYRECAAACRVLWTERSYEDEAALLAVWGAAFEGEGDLVKAARCYAGKAPE